MSLGSDTVLQKEKRFAYTPDLDILEYSWAEWSTCRKQRYLLKVFLIFEWVRFEPLSQ